MLRLRLGEVAFGVTQSAAPKRARPRAVRMPDLFDLLEDRFRLKGIAKGNNLSYLKRPAPAICRIYSAIMYGFGHKSLHGRNATVGPKTA